MKTTLVLTSPILANRDNRKTAIAAAVTNSAAELERDIKENIQRSVPAGRTYRRTAIVRPFARIRSGLKLKTRNGRQIVGYNFHRASRVGQPPAIDTGRLINSIRSLRIATNRARVIVGAEYGVPLDDPQGLDRPFFTSRVELYRPRFYENIRRAWLGK